jgi:hypothetical protein
MGIFLNGDYEPGSERIEKDLTRLLKMLEFFTVKK